MFASQKTSGHQGSDKENLAKRINEAKVLEGELAHMKNGASVYKQQQNSGIFFRQERADMWSTAKKDLQDLIEEYKEIEKETDNGQEGLGEQWFFLYSDFKVKSVALAFPYSGPRFNIKTVLSMYGDFHVKDKTAVRTSYL